MSKSTLTNGSGEAFFDVTGGAKGRDSYVACMNLDSGIPQCSEIATATYMEITELTMVPTKDKRNIGTALELAATLAFGGSGNLGGKRIDFDVLTGPHAGQNGDEWTSK